MVPVMAAGGEAGEQVMSGYVLTVDNITKSLEEESRREKVLHSLTEGSRSALGSIRAAVANLIDYPDMDAELRERFVKVVDDEAARMSQRLDCVCECVFALQKKDSNQHGCADQHQQSQIIHAWVPRCEHAL